MTLQDLIEKLLSRHGADGSCGAAEQVADHHSWSQAVGKLCDQVAAWLEPAVAAGVLAVQREEVVVEGPCSVGLLPALSVAGGRIRVRLVPAAAGFAPAVPGDVGQVHLECGPMRVQLVLGQVGEWRAVPLRGAPRRELTQDLLCGILAEMLL